MQSEQKVFCIGSGKTGTTSTGAALAALGFELADQVAGECLIEYWALRDFQPIIEFCCAAEAFQDIPFSLDYTYVALDQTFPGSKFILTVRNTSSEWYESLVRFHTRIVGKNRRPTPDDLKGFSYIYSGWLWRAHTLIFGTDESTLYDRDLCIRVYESHNAGVVDYFRHRPHDLLVLNVADPLAMDQLCAFVGKERNGLTMPHLISSREAA